MEKITKEEFETLILNGIAVDIFIAERAFSMFKTIGQKANDIDTTEYREFFMCAQAAFKDQFLLAIARIFDSHSERNKTRSIRGVINFISRNSTRLPEVIEKYNLMLILQDIGFDKENLVQFSQDGNGVELAKNIVEHFTLQLEKPENKRLLKRLKEIRDSKLAHNEVSTTNPHELSETIDPITFKDLVGLLELSKNFIGTIGWAFMSTVFLHDGRYHLTQDAQRPMHSLIEMIDKIKN